MALNKEAVIWNGSTGIVLEEFNGKYSIKAVRKYKDKSGQEVAAYDWVKKDTWDKDKRQWVTPEKANLTSGVFLGSKEDAIAALHSLLDSLEGDEPF